MILSVTGHRPDKCFTSDPYSGANYLNLVAFAVECIKSQNPDCVLTGMALGWDQAIAQACIQLGVEFQAILPCHGQDSKWPAGSQKRYREMLELASEVHTVFDGTYTENPKCMLDRNIVLVENADRLLALWNGDQAGGTAHCYRTAVKAELPIKNAWKRWLLWRDNSEAAIRIASSPLVAEPIRNPQT
jgi:uncharacterized phage-like protein YoqJ